MASYAESATQGIPDPFWVTFYLTVDPGTSPTLNATDVGTSGPPWTTSGPT